MVKYVDHTIQVVGTRDVDGRTTYETHHYQLSCKRCQMEEIYKKVMWDIKERDRVGRETYGRSLIAGDSSRDWLTEAYQEALDLAIYLKTEIERRNSGNSSTA